MNSAVPSALALAASSVFLFVHVTLADEMAFVDVSSDDSINIRSLDVTISPMHGTDNLFAADPMAAHDWTTPRAVISALEAQEQSWRTAGAAAAAARLDRLQDDLSPLYSVLPKNEFGRLDNGTVRYALHRHFAKQYGWSVKGLEPAGASWVRAMTVTPDVRQITKYIAPAYMQEIIMQKMGDSKGMDLHWLTVMAATIKHLAHSEIMEYLYSVFRTLHYDVASQRTPEEVDQIVAAFIMVYAFGTDLESSDRGDVLRTQRYLDSHHQGWRELMGRVRGELAAAEPPPRDFEGLVRFVEGWTQTYGAWQDRDCKAASAELAAFPGATAGGRVPLSGLAPSRQPGRRELFTEGEEGWDKLGILEADGQGQKFLLAPNYLLSQAMCLTTAGVHTVCCRNECDALLEQVESAAGAPQASPDTIFGSLKGAAPAVGQEALAALATSEGGSVALHGRGFAKWMHDAFPRACPVPSEHNHTNPKTPAEWMADPGDQTVDTEELIQEIAESLARYTQLGSGGQAEADDEAAEIVTDSDEELVQTFIMDKTGRHHLASPAAADLPPRLAAVLSDAAVDGAAAGSDKRRSASGGWLSGLLRLAVVGSMVGLALAAGRSQLRSALSRVGGGGGDGTKKSKKTDEVHWAADDSII